MDKDFLLNTPTARALYHEQAAQMPIIDYHCHLSPQMIAEDHRFADITELWLGGDHYKWRAMRANGVPEHYITGGATAREKFDRWAETVPYTLRNPLYHWTHMELQTAFGIDIPLNPRTADEIYAACNRRLAEPDMTARGLMRHYHVEAVCTTDDPVDSLEHHRAIRESGFEIRVLPAWRPDRAMAVADPVAYRAYVDRLAEVSGVQITDLDSLMAALQVRHDFFAESGCTVADHGVSAIPAGTYDLERARTLMRRVLGGEELAADEVNALQFVLLVDLARMNHAAGWVQQFHFGPMRNVNSRAFATLGPDTGFDTIGDYRHAEALARLLDTLDSDGRLAKTILYNLNPADNVVTAAMIANFQDGTTPGKIQWGSGWWFNDQIEGMSQQMNALSQQGLLSRFVGMLTDSRSFVSYPRHDYFRRVLCRLLGADVEEGLIPRCEMERVEGMVRDICYNNAKNYFSF